MTTNNLAQNKNVFVAVKSAFESRLLLNVQVYQYAAVKLLITFY